MGDMLCGAALPAGFVLFTVGAQHQGSAWIVTAIGSDPEPAKALPLTCTHVEGHDGPHMSVVEWPR